MKVTVTADDIRLGKREDCERCPIARATRRAFKLKSPKLIDVGYEFIFIYDSTEDNLNFTEYLMPLKAQAFVKAFDNEGRKAVKPFSFVLRKAGA